jgi:phosphoribosylamine--glycine ligase/phosphoribosylglycinamide formyltransferase/phosphoribosylformylglycinamidine cyclo-ligase
LLSIAGAHAHQLVLAAGVTVTGCTVHFVEAEVDAGAIVLQKAVPVLHGDDEDTLSERVKVFFFVARNGETVGVELRCRCT